MTTTCTDCGKSWGGTRTEHCTVCHETFSGESAGDRHRIGDHATFTGPNRRRCRTPDEMRDRGLVLNAKGIWTTGGEFPTESFR